MYVAAGKHVKIDKESPVLKWPPTYSLEATKYYMSSGLIENFKYWRSSRNSRLEANNGAVIKIAIGTKKGYGKYEIHPETTEEETNKMVCTKIKEMLVRPENFLPTIGDLNKQEGTENIRGIDCVKFTNAGETRPENEKTLWAYADNGTAYWIPVRYKTKEVDDWHGYLNNYEIWDFDNFNKDIDLDVFKMTYNCSNKENDEKASSKSSDNYLLTLNAEDITAFDDAFSTYVRQFGKQYANKEEREMRKRNFYKSWRLVTSTNNKNLGYKLTLNKLSDRIDEEISKYRRPKSDKPKTGSIPFPYTIQEIKKIANTLPKEYDLRVEGLVGPVSDALNEGCESDWAFAVTAVVEGALARSNGGTWMKLSEQALIDCSWGHGNKGCKGGSPTKSYSWIMEYGLPLQQEYGTYTNKNGFCNMKNMTKTYKIKGYTDVIPNSVDALKIALINHGPISVNLNGGYGLMLYDGGILYDELCDVSDVGDEEEKIPMTLVGYGEKDGDTFWILKESNSPYWGIDGYVYISARNNNCGVMNEATYAIA